MIRNVPNTGMDLKTAMDVVRRHGNGDLLAGVEKISAIWDDYCRNGDDRYEWDDEFIDDYNYEFDAHNKVLIQLEKLFARKAA